MSTFIVNRISCSGWQVFKLKVNKRVFDVPQESIVPVYEPVSGIFRREKDALWNAHERNLNK